MKTTKPTLEISAMIKGLRENAGLSPSELAQRSGLSLPFISKLESGSSPNLSLLTSRALADGLGFTLQTFLTKIGFINNQERPSSQMVASALRSTGYTIQQTNQVVLYAQFLKKHQEWLVNITRKGKKTRHSSRVSFRLYTVAKRIDNSL